MLFATYFVLRKRNFSAIKSGIKMSNNVPAARGQGSGKAKQ